MGMRRKLTEIEEYYVKHNPENLSIEDMAIKLNCNKNILVDIIGSAKVDVGPIQSPKPHLANTNIESNMFTQSMINKSNGGRPVSVMTENASSITDVTSKLNKPRLVDKPHIFKPRG